MTTPLRHALQELSDSCGGFSDAIGALPDSLRAAISDMDDAVRESRGRFEKIGETIATRLPDPPADADHVGSTLTEPIDSLASSFENLDELRKSSPVLRAQAESRDFEAMLKSRVDFLAERVTAFGKAISSRKEKLSEVGEDLQASGEEIIGEVEAILESTLDSMEGSIEAAADQVVSEIEDTIDIVESIDERILEAVDDAIRDQITSILEDMGVTQVMSQSLTSITPQLTTWQATASTARQILETM